MPVVKSDGTSIRLSGDYKVTINSVCKTDMYPIPRVEDLYATLSGRKVFTKLDLSCAYLQVSLDVEPRDFTTINTSRGLFRYTR